MFERTMLRDLLARRELSQRDKFLLCLASDPLHAMQVKEIRDLAIASGYRAAKNVNVSSVLSRAADYCARTTDGWELTGEGKNYVATLAGPLLPSVTPLVVSSLRKQLATLSDEETRSFVEEAVRCFEAKLYRSAIVFSWVGAVSVLQKEVHSKHLAAFNAEASRRDAKWRSAKTVDDIGRMKEFEFLQVAHALSLIGKNVKDELEVCLKLRNGCGHPNSLRVGEHKASAHVETLIQNVFAPFG